MSRLELDRLPRKIKLRARSPDRASLGIEIDGLLVFEDADMYAVKVAERPIGIIALKQNYREISTDLYGREYEIPPRDEYVWRCATCGDEFDKRHEAERLEHAEQKEHYTWSREWPRRYR